MKIIRFLANDNNEHYGVIKQAGDKEASLIEGSIFGEFTTTTKSMVINKLLAPVQPPNIIGIGLNYKNHADETGIQYPEIPVMFLKGTNSVIGPEEPVILPEAGPDEVDFEAELAVIIGTKAKDVSPANAFDVILGYCCANDISARDWQIHKQKKQWARGKSFDTFCPLGPWIVTRDEIPDPGNLSIRCTVNGQVMQSSHTSDMIFNVPQLVSLLSHSMTLLPGTVILTGTPGGVGFTRRPPIFLKPGDRVTVTIEKVGELANGVK